MVEIEYDEFVYDCVCESMLQRLLDAIDMGPTKNKEDAAAHAQVSLRKIIRESFPFVRGEVVENAIQDGTFSGTDEDIVDFPTIVQSIRDQLFFAS